MNYDVLIVGAGPAGLSSAYAAAEAGVKVAVFEKSKEIGYPIHTSGGSWIDELRKLDIPERFMNPINEGFFISANERAEFKYKVPPSCVIDIRGLYQYLAEIASEAGAEIYVNTNVKGVWRDQNKISGLKVRRSGQDMLFKAPLIIDASGMACVIAREAGLTNGFQRFGTGAEYDIYAPDWPHNRVAFLFGSKFSPSGYAWVFPYKKNRVRIGVGIIYPDSSEIPKKYLERIISNSNIFNGALSRISRIEYHTGVIPCECYLQKTISDGILVVGDAAGLSSTLLGEGIRFAIDIGRIAGKVAGETVSNKRFDAQFLSKYETIWKMKYERIFQIGAYFNKRILKYSDEQWDNIVKEISKLEPQLIPTILKGDFSVKNIINIIKSNPNIFKHKVVSSLKSILKNA